MKIHENIRSFRLEARLSQEELGSRVGVSGQAVSKWESGLTSPDISALPMLSKVLGVSIDALFSAGPSKRYGAYGSGRNELLAVYESPESTEEDFRRAADAFAEIIMKGGADIGDYVGYGLLHHIRARRDAEIAEKYYRKAIEQGGGSRDIDWMQAHTQLANLMHYLGRNKEMVKEYAAWAEKEPDSCGAHEQLALVLMREGRMEEAYAEIQKALSLDADNVNAQTLAGDLCGQMGKYEEAFLHWDRAYELDDRYISGWFSKAEAYVGMGEKEKAIGQYEKILAWLEERGYDMRLEGEYPLRRIREIEEGTDQSWV